MCSSVVRVGYAELPRQGAKQPAISVARFSRNFRAPLLMLSPASPASPQTELPAPSLKFGGDSSLKAASP